MQGDSKNPQNKQMDGIKEIEKPFRTRPAPCSTCPIVTQQDAEGGCADSRHAQKRIQQVLAQGKPSPSAKHIRSAKQQYCHSKRSGFLGAVLSRPAKQQGEYRRQPCPVADAAQQDQSQNRSGFSRRLFPCSSTQRIPKQMQRVNSMFKPQNRSTPVSENARSYGSWEMPANSSRRKK